MSAHYSPVPELNLLAAFQAEVGAENYSECFALTEFGDTSGIEAGWFKDPSLLAGLIPFAQANGSGSFYALWRIDDRADLATLPVVVFGNEGGQHVVARNLPELFRLVAYDSEIMVDWDTAYFYRREDDEHAQGHDRFVAWLEQNFGLAPADDPDAIIAVAQAELAEAFDIWTTPHLPG
jgi:hypothetical protein